MAITRKSKAEIAKMRSAGRIVAEVLALMEESLAPGVSTAELDRLAERHIRERQAACRRSSTTSAAAATTRDDPHAYPASTCISIDDEIVHGIPGDRELKAGQIVSIDVGRDLRRLARRRRAQLHLRRPEAAHARGRRPGARRPGSR